MKKINITTKNIIVLGILSGMRANAGLLCTSLLIRQQPGVYFNPERLIQFFKSDKTLIGLYVSGAGELVMDKLPFTPARIVGGGLAARIVTAAICGAAVSKAAGKAPVKGIILGGLSALASTFAFYYLRKDLSKASNIPDLYIGAAEDAIAVAMTVALLKSNKSYRLSVTV